MAVQQLAQATPQAIPERIDHKDEAAKWFISFGLVNLVIFGFFGLITAIKFVAPTFPLPGINWLAWPRTREAHYNGVTFGWIISAAFGLFFYMVPRLCGTQLYSERLGKISCVIYNFGIWFATFFLLNPMDTTNLWLMNKGKEWEDYDPISNAIIVVGLLMAAYNVFRTVANRRYKQMYVALWYIMGCIMWTSFIYTIGNWPSQLLDTLFHTHWGFYGSNDANVNWFYGHTVVGLVATPAALGIGYYFIPKSANVPLFSHKLSIVGFWLLGAIYIWVGAHHLILGPIPYWLQNVATIFSFLLFIPVYAAVVNFIGTVKGEWHQLRYNVVLKFCVAATIMYAMVSTQGSFMALRSVSAYAHFTDHTIGHSHLALFGFVTMFEYAGLLYAAPRIWRKPLYSEGIAEWSFWLSFLGIVIYLASMSAGGIGKASCGTIQRSRLWTRSGI